MKVLLGILMCVQWWGRAVQQSMTDCSSQPLACRTLVCSAELDCRAPGHTTPATIVQHHKTSTPHSGWGLATNIHIKRGRTGPVFTSSRDCLGVHSHNLKFYCNEGDDYLEGLDDNFNFVHKQVRKLKLSVAVCCYSVRSCHIRKYGFNYSSTQIILYP